MHFFLPTFDEDLIAARLGLFLVPGPLDLPYLTRRLARLRLDFSRYLENYPQPVWAPGLRVTQEMRSLTEALLPLKTVLPPFRLLLRESCRFPPCIEATGIEAQASWLDLLTRLAPFNESPDPARLLSELAADPKRRRLFLFVLFLPRHFGGGFDRYPAQYRWIAQWLSENRRRLDRGVRVLDSACGSGEGCYGVGELLAQGGFSPKNCAIHGSTLELFELFAAAHGYFPHDLERQREFRSRVAPLLTQWGGAMEFYAEDLREKGRGDYDLVLCNGLLGGPILHREPELARALANLARRLRPGGVLLAADRFHAGWRARVPRETLLLALRRHGLVPLPVPEGIAAQRPS